MGVMIERIEQITGRGPRAHTRGRLADLLDLPLKLRKDRDREPHLLDR
jgi:hypothetical protein